jgi:hypothetical protein
MDILNFISWIKGKRLVTTVDSAKTLLPVALKDNRRDDDYLTGAITVQDLAAQITPQPPYKVYTALLTQSGGNDPIAIAGDGEVINIGVTYQITDNPDNYDLTIYGAPNNNVGTYFVANQTINLPYTVSLQLLSNTGAPVVTVLENTIGNIWFTYNGIGNYNIYSDGLFTENKTTFSIILMGDELSNGYLCKGYMQEPTSCGIVTGDISTSYDNILNWKTPIEIRVYN